MDIDRVELDNCTKPVNFHHFPIGNIHHVVGYGMVVRDGDVATASLKHQPMYALYGMDCSREVVATSPSRTIMP